MRKNKGFTLIELLAVIVILAIVAVIAIPVLLGVIDNVKLSAYRQSLTNIFDAVDLYIASNGFEDLSTEGLSVNSDDLQIKNKNFISGQILKNEDEEIILENVSNGTYCGGGTRDNIIIIEGGCELLDITAPIITIDYNLVTSSTVSIIGTAVDEESGISGYQFSKDNGLTWTPIQESNTYTFVGLTSNTEYSFQAKAINNNNLETVSDSLILKTNNIVAPTYSVDKTGWSKSKIVTINYPEREGNYVYEYSLDNALTWETVEEPLTTKEITFSENGNVIARILEGTNEIIGINYEVTNIDTVKPVINVNPSAISIYVGDNYDLSIGVTSSDNTGISPTITRNLEAVVDLLPGTYNVIYTATDVAGNVATATRTVTVNDPIPEGWLVIRTPEDLYNIRNNLTERYYVANDIDLTSSTYSTWTPIVGFGGKLDGGGHKITGLKTTSTSTSNIGLFGTITGSNAEIKNLELNNVDLKGSSYVGGIAGNVSGSNLKITNIKITGSINGNNYVGGIVGYVNTTITVTGSYTTGTITAGSTYAGGLIGRATSTTTISNSYTTGNVTGRYYVGGLAGYISGGTVSKSYTSGNITATGSDSSSYCYLGGLIGYNDATLSDVYTLGDIKTSGGTYVGGLVGYNAANISRAYTIGKITGSSTGSYVGPIIGRQYSGTLTNLYWVIDTSLIYSSNVSATGINTIVQGTYKGSYTGFDFTNVWDTIEGETSPYLKGMMLTTKNYIVETQHYAREGAGTVSDPYLIKTPEDLYQIRTSLNASFKLANDIDLTNSPYSTWTPIIGFTGTLDGANHQIIGLKTTSTTSSDIGLFGTLTANNVEIKNIQFTNVSLTGSSNIGAVVGDVSGNNLKITNVKVSGSVNGGSYVGSLVGIASGTLNISNSVASNSVSGTSYIGGFVGRADNTTTITNSYTSGNITGSSSYAGGFIGYTGSGVTITGSYTTGTITAVSTYAGGLIGRATSTTTISNSYTTGNITGRYYVGGLAGYVSGGTISKSYTSGDTTATGSTTDSYCYLGGLIGYNDASLSDVYTLGNIKTSGGTYVGGLVGYNAANISRAYTIGKITGSSTGSYVGPIIGKNFSGILSNLYWVIDTSLIYSSNVSATGINTIVQGTYKGSYTNFDFTNVWDTIEGETTPYLRGLLLNTKNYITETQHYAREGAGTVSDPYLIKTPEDLYQIRTSLNASFKLVNDIDLTSSAYSTWTPIIGFTGTLDGDGYKIIGLKTTSTTNSNIGLFGTLTTNNIEIKNIRFTNVSLTGSSNIGAVVGESTGTNLKITNVRVSGSVNGSSYVGSLVGIASGTLNISNSVASNSVSGTSYIGGFVGRANNTTTITNSYITGNVSGSSSYAGGFIGYTGSGVTITGSYTTGIITAGSTYAGGLIGRATSTTTISNSYTTGNVTGRYYVGGLAGYISGGTVSKSYTSGNITATGSDSSSYCYVGGLIGYNDATLSDVYTLGDIKTSGGTYVGGLVGYNAANISRAYTIGKITGSSTGSYVGPIIGRRYSGTLTGLYWIIDTSLIYSSNVSATGINTIVSGTYKNSYANFDFASTWDIIEEETTPYIKGMILTDKHYIVSTQNYVREGAGTVSDPYLIKTPEDLYQIRTSLNASYKLTNDINLTSSAYSTWKPIVGFTGTLDGAGYKIIGLKTTSTTNSNIGLFGTLTADNVEIKNIEFNNVSLTGNSNIGAVVGDASGDNLKITNIKVSGSVNGSSYVGSLVGIASGTLNISNSTASNSVSGTSYIGGFVGKTENTATITNSYITGNVSGSSSYAGGFIGYTGNGVAITGSYTTGTITAGSTYAGGLIGRATSTTTISNSYTTGNITGRYYVGGLAGYVSGGTISKSYTSGDITATGYNSDSYCYLGGLIGYNDASLSDVYTLGDIKTSGGTYVGGLVGYNAANISRVYTIGKITGSSTGSYVGPIIGKNYSGTLTNLYWVIDSSLIYSSNVSATGINTIVQGTYKSSYTGFDFTNVWDTIEGQTTPYLKGMLLDAKNYITETQHYAREGAGTVSDPYLIKTPEDLYQIRTSLNASFKLANDIDLAGSAYSTWTPIIGFTGTLDGGNHKINGLKTTSTANSDIGLFGTLTTNNIEIKNIEFTNVSLTGNSNIGTVVGESTGANLKITNVKVSGSVNGSSYVGSLVGIASGTLNISNSTASNSVSGTSYLGGFVGRVNNTTTITNSYTSGNITGSSSYAGGFIGYTGSGVTITGSYTTGIITAGSTYAGGLIGRATSTTTISNSYTTGNITGRYYVGGLAGYVSGGTVSKSYTSGNITATGSDSSSYCYIGGLIGYNDASLSDVYTLGDIKTSGGTNVGGLVGYNAANISRAYTIGKITGSSTGSYVGPIIGRQYSGTLTSLYWDTNASGITTGNYGIGKSTSEMYQQNTFSGWDFASIWTINTNSYPTLR